VLLGSPKEARGGPRQVRLRYRKDVRHRVDGSTDGRGPCSDSAGAYDGYRYLVPMGPRHSAAGHPTLAGSTDSGRPLGAHGGVNPS
jgi:hypothetical protein